MTDDEKRRRAAAPISEIAADVLKLVPHLTDEEWAARDAEVARLSAARDAESSRTRLDALLELGFPQLAVDVVRAGVAQEPAIERLRTRLASSEILVISGPKGTGKTVAATWWASQRRGRIRFVRASSFAASSRYERAEREDLLAHPLVLDDLGAEFVDAKGSFLADLDELVDVFYSSRRALVVTTNCTGAEFSARYGERIADRLRECGRWIALTGESLRKRST